MQRNYLLSLLQFWLNSFQLRLLYGGQILCNQLWQTESFDWLTWYTADEYKAIFFFLLILLGSHRVDPLWLLHKTRNYIKISITQNRRKRKIKKLRFIGTDSLFRAITNVLQRWIGNTQRETATLSNSSNWVHSPGQHWFGEWTRCISW